MDKFIAMLLVLFGASSYGVLATIFKIGYGQGFTVGKITDVQMFSAAVMLLTGKDN